ncbi:MAG: DUF4062 domain-containing protein [Acidimicrobiales bacterium]
MAPEMRIFISSTFEDLKEHRQATHDAIQGLDLHADNMVFWSADERSGATQSLDRVRNADVAIFILAHRYGYVPEGSEHSVTELEYRAARGAGVPVLAFFLDGSVPWPPHDVEWEARDRLGAFKALIEAEVTRKLFRTPEDLAVQVTQALALLRERRRGRGGSGDRLLGPVPDVSVARRLTVAPDLLVQLGTAEDGLPLLLDVRRSRDLSGLFEQLARAVSSPTQPSPVAMLQTFRQSLEEYATATWAADQLVPVRLRSGEVRDLFVPPFTLSGPFISMLAALLDRRASSARAPFHRGGDAATAEPAFLDRGGSVQVWHSMASLAPPAAGPTWELQSSGGSNRFLGVSPDDGAVYSVGRSGGAMVEWRPFYFESALDAFGDADFELRSPDRTRRYPLREVPDRLWKDLAGVARDPAGAFAADTRVVVRRQTIVRLLAAVAKAVGELHDAGMLHGDLKPHNVLATEHGVVLIDSFDVTPGHPSPGWTPNWSAPEQVLGLPLTPAADVYPVARMIGRLLGGQLVGEVRRYRAPKVIAGSDNFELVHDPSLFLGADGPPLDAETARHWRHLVEKALRFEPDAREPQSVQELEHAVHALADDFPLPGEYQFTPSGRLTAARLVDGADVVARTVSTSDAPRLPAPITSP